jgi:hypothetical protein
MLAIAVKAALILFFVGVRWAAADLGRRGLGFAGC